MTTTLTSVPPVAPALSGSASTRASRATAAGRRRTLQLTLGVVIVGLVAAVVWATTSWTRAATQIANVDKFTVAPQTFTVALKEKGELKAAKSTDIKCEVEGKSTIISLIDEGTNVKEGDLLVELASDEIVERIRQEELTESNAITAFEAAKTELDIQRDKNASDIRKAELQIELKRLELDKYEKGDWEQKLKDARIAIEQATISLQRRDQDYNASKELYAKKFITQTEYQEDEFNFKKAQWDLDKANKAIEVLETYTHVAELRQKQSDLEEATKECERVKKNAEAEEVKKVRASEGKEKELALTQDKLAKLRGQREKCRIFAPTQGFVVYYNEDRRWGSSESQMKVGASVIERQILMQLPDTSKMTATVRVHEAKTDKLHLGQSAMVSVEGLPGKRFPGSVTKIAALADSTSGWLNPTSRNTRPRSPSTPRRNASSRASRPKRKSWSRRWRGSWRCRSRPSIPRAARDMCSATAGPVRPMFPSKPAPSGRNGRRLPRGSPRATEFAWPFPTTTNEPSPMRRRATRPRR